MAIEHPDVSQGFHLFKDGNAWCAVGPHFQNLQESDAGFGDTMCDATNALEETREKRRQCGEKNLKRLTWLDFKVHGEGP